MSVIIHRCPDCGHKDLEHPDVPNGKNTCCHGNCGCRAPRRTVAESNPSEVIPTFNLDNSVNPIITTPGTAFHGIVRTCACTDCKALCDKLGGMA